MRRTELAQVMPWRERVPWNGTASRGHMAKRTILCRKCVKLWARRSVVKCCFATSNPWFARASKRQCPGEALLLVVKVVWVVFLTYPNDNEDIEQRKANLLVKYWKVVLVVFLACPNIVKEMREKTSFVKPLNEKKNHGWKEKTGMALRHSDRHLDPHGHSHGPRRDELHGWCIARACIICPRAFIFSTARSLWWSRSVSSLIN